MYTGVSCGDPPPVTNAFPGTPSRTTYLGTVLYTCDTGYQISSPQQQLSVWLTGAVDLYTNLSAYVKLLIIIITVNGIYTVVDCGSPPTIVSGSPGTPSSTTYLGTVLYTCDSGYEVSTGVTTATATCMASGNWGPLPTCQRMYQLLPHTCT